MFELLSIVKTALSESTGSDEMQSEAESALQECSPFLESLLSDIYFGWSNELLLKFREMVIPGIIESEDLPGFATSGGSSAANADVGFLRRMVGYGVAAGGGRNGAGIKFDDVHSFLDNIWKIMEYYAVDQVIMKQIIGELLGSVGLIGFNNIIMRYCLWQLRLAYCTWDLGKTFALGSAVSCLRYYLTIVGCRNANPV